jgi:hypothetical protein
MAKKSELKVIENEISDSKSYQSLGTFDDMLILAEKLVKMESKLVPFKKAGDVVVVLQAARDFKIPITFALANIHPISGKASAGVHLLSAQLLKNNIVYEIVEDYEPIYEYIGEGGIPISHDEFHKNRDEYYLIGAKTPKDKYHKTKLNVLRKKEIDRRTKIKFERIMPQPDGTHHKMTIYGQFSRNEGIKAGLYEQNPHTWNKYERAMIYARAFGDGSKKIGNDVLLGMNEVSMMCDTFDIPYTTDQDGNAVPNVAKAKIIKADDAEEIDIEEV